MIKIRDLPKRYSAWQVLKRQNMVPDKNEETLQLSDANLSNAHKYNTIIDQNRAVFISNQIITPLSDDDDHQLIPSQSIQKSLGNDKFVLQNKILQ